ncbi:MAG: electron transport complex subunit E [Gammaproteobacteria bacterium]|nr:electron transport complex subunit E [Gammaproteobacteria bacterium]
MKELRKGIFKENPVLILLLGLCPALAVSSSIVNAIGMGLAATFVLVASNTIISIFGRFFPSKIRIPCFIVVIATFVTMVEMIMNSYTPELNAALGIFIPLIVVNCIILGRAEAFASRNKLWPSILDGLGMGAGFTLALTIIAFFREVLGSGTFLNIRITDYYGPVGPVAPAAVMIMAPGAFIVIALLIGFINLRKEKHIRKS